jgi:serine/threonine-protein kinase
MSTDAGHSLIGTVLADRYRVVRKLGEGGMGVVFEAQHVLIERRLAVKLLHSEYARDPATVARFRREALATARIGNEHIVESVDMGSLPDGSVFIVLEFLDGREFEKTIAEEGPLSIARIADIGVQICEGLEAAHAAGIVHRDLKPANIYLVRRGSTSDFVKILDFGISKFQEKDTSAQLQMTKTGAMIGTPYYMPPEQVEGRKDIDLRADVYALGVILFRALTGSHPIEADTYGMLMVKIVTETPPDVRTRRPDVPDELASLIARMLSKDRSARPADCGEVRRALARFIAHAGRESIGHDATLAIGGFAQTGDLVNPRTGAGAVGVVDTVLPANPARAASAPEGSSGAVAVGEKERASRVPVSAPPSVSTVSPVERAAKTATTSSSAPSNRGMFVGLAMGAVLVLAGAGGAVVVLKRDSTRSDPARTVASVPALPEAVPTRPAPPTNPQTSPAAPVAASVHITIHTTPNDATVLLDNTPLSNPFDGSMPRSDRVMRLEARRAGYRTVLMDLVPTFDQNVAIPLQRGSGTVDRRQTRAGGLDVMSGHVPPTERAATSPTPSIAPEIAPPAANNPQPVRPPTPQPPAQTVAPAEPPPQPVRTPPATEPQPAHPIGPPPAPAIRDPI